MIKPADKGSAVVVMNLSNYKAEGEKTIGQPWTCMLKMDDELCI